MLNECSDLEINDQVLRIIVKYQQRSILAKTTKTTKS